MIKRAVSGCLFVLLLFSLGLTGWAQVDSLRNVLKKPLGDLDMARTHNRLAWELRDIRPDSAFYHASMGVRIANKAGHIHEAIEGTNYMGVANRNLSNYSEAFEYYLGALRRAQETDDGEQIGYSLINIGNLHGYQSNHLEAINYFEQAIEQSIKLGDQRMLGYSYVNLGRAYSGVGDFGESESYFKKALDVRESLGDDHGIKAVKTDLAELYRLEGNLDKALNFSLTAIETMDTEADSRILLDLLGTIALIYFEKGDLPKAESDALRSLELARAYDSPYDEKEALLILSKVYKATGRYAKALGSHEDYAELNQQLFSEESIRRIEQLKNQRRIQEQEAENEFNQRIIEKQQNTIIFAIAGGLLFVVLAAITYRAYLMKLRLSRKVERQRDKIEGDKNVIEQQSQKLRELDEAKSRFFANVSHDLRSPLSLILGNLEMISEDDQNVLSAQSKKNLEVGFKNSKRLLHLTDEINDITRLEEGRITLRLEKVKINSYLQMLCDMFKATADYKGIHLEYNGSVGDSVEFAVDPRQFEKIFYNLVSNAIRHTRSGERITIGAHREGSDVVLSFSDTGDGIPSESLPYVFDRFYQSKSNQFKSREGLGIGLALVKELVHLHDGVITVESKLEEGTTFTIRLRNQERQHLPGDVSAGVGTYLEQQSNLFRDLEVDTRARANLPISEKDLQRTVLIVDDHPEIRYYIRQVLEHDFHVVEASHGLEAIDLLKNKEIDVIITDLMMPLMDGFELIESLNQSDNLRKVPLLVVSARITEETKEQVLSLGVNEFLQKPFHKKELLMRIENLLIQRSKYDDTTESIHHLLTSDEHISSVEQEILEKLEKFVKENIDDPRLSVLQLADAIAASERQVYRLVKKITGLTPHEYITEVRMQYVDYLIRNNLVRNPTEAAKKVGQRNVTTFSRQFQRKFGLRPSELFKS
ncbi:MAG: tetratricopeptide repeat protein [Bacteroidota bacterium]